MKRITILAEDYEEFRDLMRSTLGEVLPSLLSELVQPKSSDLITQKEALKLLGVSATTLIEWKKLGLVPFKRFGGRIYFDKADLLAAGSAHEKYMRSK